jgi:predicted nucleic-acid-binding Zn-ribbon protein
MARSKKKTPSRIKYEESHPVFSTRLDRGTFDHLNEHLRSTGYSRADFIKDALGRENSMIEKRVEMLASRQIDPPVEHRLRCLEDLVQQIFTITVDTDEYPPYCPHCDNQELFEAEGRETESSLAHPWVITWKCPKCGFFMNTYKRIDPKSIKRIQW